MLEIDNFNKIIVANWKLYGSFSFIKSYLKNIKFDSVREQTKCVIICPPFPFINQINSQDLLIGAQNCSIYIEGAYTGEISTKVLKDIGCDFCIIGHSERRSLFAETDEIIFTSGATESNNLAIKSMSAYTTHKHIITQATEHKCVLKSCASLLQAKTMR